MAPSAWFARQSPQRVSQRRDAGMAQSVACQASNAGKARQRVRGKKIIICWKKLRSSKTL